LQAAHVQQVAEAEAGQAGEGHQVDVGIELRLRVLHVLAGGFDAPARGGDVGAAAEQVGGQRRQRGGGGRVHRRRLPARRHVGLAHQGSQRIAGELRLFLQRFDLLARFGQRAFALAQLQRGVEAGAHALAHQLQLLFARCSQRAPGHAQLLVQAHQLEVAARHVAGQHHAGGVDVGLGGAAAPRAASSAASFLPKKSSSQLAIQLQQCRCHWIEPPSGSG
jgi:hypothetical protein